MTTSSPLPQLESDEVVVSGFGADCDRHIGALTRYWTGEVELEEQRALHAHLRECGRCKERYVADSLVAAAIARDGRVGRLEAQRVARRRWLQSLGRNIPARVRGLWVRTLLVPALLIVVLARPPAVDAIARVRSERGAYQVGERSLASEHKPQRLHRGDVIVAGDDSEVVLFDRDAELRVRGPASLLSESPVAHRYRLGFGRFAVRGPHVLTTPWTVAEIVSGAATVELDERGVSIRVDEGVSRVATAEGERELVAGDSVTFGSTPLPSATANDGL